VTPGDDLTTTMGRVIAGLPAAEARPGQVQMARTVGRAIAEHRHLVVQAGTGTGKSLAYLVPAVLSGATCVVATATKALQDQLAIHDLPLVARHLGVPVTFAVLKGRSNYLCRQRAAEVAGGDDQLALEDAEEDGRTGPLGRQVLRLVEWGRSATTGDRADLDFEPGPRAWSAVSVSATECPGAARCPRGDECFAEAARHRAEEADVVVVNTHLYGAHLASGGHVLPPHEVVVFDEAHELEDVAATSLGLELGAGRFRALAAILRAVVDPAGMAAVDGLAEAGDGLAGAFEPWRGRRLPADLGPEVSTALVAASERVARALAAARRGEGDVARKARALQAGGHLGADLAMVTNLPATHVAWVEGTPSGPVLKVAVVDVAQRLADVLWGEVTAVLTSATIPPGLAGRVGLDPATCDVVDVGSPFSFREQAMLYCPRLPRPQAVGYEEAVHDEVLALMRAAGGRTLALFTSRRALEAAAAALAPQVPWRLLRQDELPKPALVAAFSSDPTSCLFATMGFWQGVDVPGPALSVVAIDRIPFPRPDEPLVQARRDRAGPAAFRLVDLPRAATLLAQGAGRLIRSTTDRGVVAVLDSRLATSSYKAELLAALPPMRRTRDRAEVERFLAPLREA